MAFANGCLVGKTHVSLECGREGKEDERCVERGRTARGPLRAMKFFLTLSIAPSGITVRPSLSIGVTSTGSHLMGTLAAAKMSLTAWEISGPIPSPSIRVTAYLP